jgi:hypothetical protein
MTRIKLFSVAMMAGILFFACGKEDNNTYDCNGVTPTYTNDIKSVMDNSCALAGCHDAASKEQGYDLSNYSGVKAASAKDAFLGSMEHKGGFDAMPKGASQLSTATLQKIYCWIQNGTPQ